MKELLIPSLFFLLGLAIGAILYYISIKLEDK